MRPPLDSQLLDGERGIVSMAGASRPPRGSDCPVGIVADERELLLTAWCADPLGPQRSVIEASRTEEWHLVD